MNFSLKLVIALVILTIENVKNVEIECFFDLELLFDDMKLAYTCTVLHLTTNSTDRNITKLTATDEKKHALDGNDKVTQLYIIHQKMEYFPLGFVDYFTNLNAIHAGMNELKYLERNDMRDFTKLRFLYLYSNHLENLQSDVFLDNLELEYVSFYNNRLMHIGSKLLTPLKKLRTAYFNKNICIDKQAVQSFKEVAEIKLEISERCSDITDEDLMNVLKQNQEKIASLEGTINLINNQLSELVQHLNLSNKTEL